MSDVITEATAETVESETPMEKPSADEATSVETTAEYQALNQQYLRLAADFENFRKRTLQEADNLRKYGAENTIKALLGALDNIDRGTQSLTAESDPAVLYKSLSLLQQEIINSLSQQGLSRMDVVGQPFDPNQHEAISQQASETIPADHVIQDVQAGYCLHDRVIRPALVIVSTGVEAA